MHPKTAIRRALAALLRDPVPGSEPPVHPTAAGGRVFATGGFPVPADDAPALLVRAGEDRRADDRSSGLAGPVRRRLGLTVRARAGGEDAEAVVEALCLEVETAVLAAPVLGGLVESIRWEVTDAVETEGETGAASAVMSFAAVYHSHLPPPDGGAVPTRVFWSEVPRVGAPHEDSYQEVQDGILPEVAP